MRAIMKKIMLLSFFSVAAICATAQEKYFYANFDINTPKSNTSWLRETTANGIKVGYRHFINRKFSAGVDLGYASYDEYFPERTFYRAGGATTTDNFNYITSYNVAVSGQYNLPLKSELVYPYVGVGIGASSLEYSQYYNVFSNTERSWGFLARPEAGVLLRVFKRRSFGLMAAVHYDYSTNKSESNGYSNFTNLGVQFGVMFMDW
jgi:hypothetical protein